MPTAPKPSIPQRSSLGRTAASRLAAAGAATTPATAPTIGVVVQEYGSGALVVRGTAKTPEQIVNTKLIKDCWKETARGIKSRAQFEAFCKGLGIRVEWVNLDGGGVNCILYLVMGKNKRTVQIQCQYLHGQNHFNKAGKINEGFGVPELLYVDADGKLVAQFADGARSPVVLRIHHAAPDAAISVRSLLHDLETLAALDSKAPNEKNWVACSSKGRVGFNRGSVGTAFLNHFEKVQKSLASAPTEAAAVPYIDMRDANAAEQFKHVLESALTLALGTVLVARAGSPLMSSKVFPRERTKTLGPFDTPEAKDAAEKIALKAVETLQLKLVEASSRQALVVAPTAAFAHLQSLRVEPLASQSEKAATPEEAVTRLGLSFEVFDACMKACARHRPSCTCTNREWRKRGKLVKLSGGHSSPIRFFFDDNGKELSIKKVSHINERLKPASGKGDALTLVRKAARAMALAGWDAPSELASVSRARRGG